MCHCRPTRSQTPELIRASNHDRQPPRSSTQFHAVPRSPTQFHAVPHAVPRRFSRFISRSFSRRISRSSPRSSTPHFTLHFTLYFTLHFTLYFTLHFTQFFTPFHAVQFSRSSPTPLTSRPYTLVVTRITVHTLEQRIHDSLGANYEIERELVGGGMSRVFVARDTRLDRRVVVKVLRPELAIGVSVERFRREILLAASLQHPHIVPVLAAGEVDGLPYFIMPFVDGESLRMRLQRSGTLSVPETVRILRDVARALSVAHARAVVHRDIKPDNVLLALDAAVVADFGVAKAFASARAGEETDAKPHAITTIGTSLGTPAYMAPEQVAADPNAGHHIDIYAFGVMAYEMLAGATPFAGRSPQAIMAAQIAEMPAPLQQRQPGVPDALATLVMRCLEKDADKRPMSAAAIVEALEDPAVVSGSFTPLPEELNTGRAAATGAAPTSGAVRRIRRRQRLLRRVALAAVVIVLGAIGFLATRPGDGSETQAPPAAAALPPSVAVLPFVYLGPDSTQEWTARAVADAITNGVVGMPGLRVASRSASDQLQRRLALGDRAAMTVSTLVEGVVEQEGNRVRLSVRLVDAADGFTLFADQYEGDASRLFEMEDRIVAAIREMLRQHFDMADSTGAGGRR